MRLALIAIACTTKALALVIPTPSSHRTPWRSTTTITPPHRLIPSQKHPRMSTQDDDTEMDWREMRARLIAQDRADTSAASSSTATTPSPPSSSYVYETPLIEQGTILLGGTRQDVGFALRQQFFHKSVMLLLQHDKSFTKGIILNRPSNLEIDGWRAWCGHGQVAEGGLFVGSERMMGEREVNVLHSLSSPAADRVSTRVIKGISYTDLEVAKELVEAGEAVKEDFWVCVGYSGWAPGQLQMEVEKRDSWYLASADGGTLLKELLREARELPPPGDGNVHGITGIDTWENLMNGIGRQEDVLKSRNTLEDRMLEQWVRVHLVPKPIRKAPDTPPPVVKTGTVLGTMVPPGSSFPADRFLIHDQYLHKSLLLVLEEKAQNGKISACILNRPTASVLKFNLPGAPKRRVPFTGNRSIRDELWLTHRSDLDGIPVGDSGISILSVVEMSSHVKSSPSSVADFLIVRGVVQFSQEEITGMLAVGEVSCLTPGEKLQSLWPRVWALTDGDDGRGEVSDGTEMWWLASQCGARDKVSVSSDLADEALDEWLKFFAGIGREGELV